MHNDTQTKDTRHMSHFIPVITLDGPAASGKGTIAERVAAALGFHYLDSGALYRIATLNALRHGVPLDDGCRAKARPAL